MPIYQYNTKSGTRYMIQTRVKGIDGNLKRITERGFKTKKQARDREAEITLNKNVRIVYPTMDDLITEYIKHKKPSLKQRSYDTIMSRTKIYIRPYFNVQKCNLITYKEINEWQEKIDNTKLSYSSKRALNVLLSSMFKYAVRYYDLPKNPVEYANGFKVQNGIKKEPMFWTFKEYKKFIANVDEKYKPLFELLYYSGLRLGEALALTWDDINNQYINVNKTVTRRIKGEVYTLSTPKAKSSVRVVKIPKFVVNNLEETKPSNAVGKSFIFGGIVPFSENAVTNAKNVACKKANIKQIRIHDLRHSHASLLLSNGIPIPVISKRLGHSNISMTLDVYSHMIKEDEDKAVELLEKL